MQDSSRIPDARFLVAGAGAMGMQAVAYLLEDGVQAPNITVLDSALVAGKRLASLAPAARFCQGELEHLPELMEEIRPDVVVCMVPPQLAPTVAKATIEAGCPGFVSTNFLSPDLAALGTAALERQVSVWAGFGFDPGIDRLLLQVALSGFDRVDRVASYGSGVPEQPGRNPLNYAVTWRFQGFLEACMRPAELREAGKRRCVSGDEIFAAENIHRVRLCSGADMEAYPNGSAYELIEEFSQLKDTPDVGVYTLRWPGHAAFFRELVGYQFLSAEAATGPQPGARVRDSVRRHLAGLPVQGNDDPLVALAMEQRNGDALAERASSEPAGSFWRTMAELGFFSPDAIPASAGTMLELSAHVMEPRLQLAPDERDMALLRIVVEGERRGRRVRQTREMVDFRDLAAGRLAMGRGVAKTVERAAIRVLDGTLKKPGVHSVGSVTPEQGQLLLQDLEAAGMNFHVYEEPLE